MRPRSAAGLLLLALGALAAWSRFGGAPARAPACNSLVIDGPFVAATDHQEEQPRPLAGVLENGTYHLSAWHLYPGATPPARKRRATIVVYAGDYELATQDEGGPVRRTRGAIEINDDIAHVSFNASCPARSAPDPTTYTALPASLEIVRASEHWIEHYTREGGALGSKRSSKYDDQH